MEDFLSQLNKEQLSAVETTEGHIRVMAGAGTGKTKTLTGDTLIFAVGYASAPLKNDRIIQIGDSNKVGNLKDAISSAYQLAVTL